LYNSYGIVIPIVWVVIAIGVVIIRILVAAPGFDQLNLASVPLSALLLREEKELKESRRGRGVGKPPTTENLKINLKEKLNGLF